MYKENPQSKAETDGICTECYRKGLTAFGCGGSPLITASEAETGSPEQLGWQDDQ